MQQDVDIGHYAVAANLAREIFHRRKEFNFFIERHDFVVIDAEFYTIAFNLLGPRDEQAEVRCFGQLGNFGCLRRAEQLGFHPNVLKMLDGALT